MLNSNVNTPTCRKTIVGKLTFKRTHHRELSVGTRISTTYRDPICDSETEQSVKTPISFVNSNNPLKNSKFLASKQNESALKEIINQFDLKKIKSIKKERDSNDSQKLFISFLMIFVEIDPTINIRGLKVSPYEVMMNYLSVPSKVEKTLEKADFCLKNHKITDRTLFQAHSYYASIQPDNLSTSKIIYSLLGIIFKFFGIENPISKDVLKPSNSLSLAKSTLQMIKTPSGTDKKSVNNENFMIKSTENEKPEKIFTDVTFILETSNRPPRISQKYLDSKMNRNSRSLSSAYFVIHPQIVS